jgi:hypothetical protein
MRRAAAVARLSTQPSLISGLRLPNLKDVSGHCDFGERTQMKLTTAVLFFLAILYTTIPFNARAVEGAMVGREPTYRGGATGVSHGGSGGGGAKAAGGTCSQAVQRCKKNFAAAASACQSAGESCKQTGTFTNPQGKSFSGLTKN